MFAGRTCQFVGFVMRLSYVLKVSWDALITEGGEEQPNPIKLGVSR